MGDLQEAETGDGDGDGIDFVDDEADELEVEVSYETLRVSHTIFNGMAN